VRHLAPTAGQIEVRYSKNIIGCSSGAKAALVGPLPTFVSTVQHHCCHSSYFCKRTDGHSSYASAEKTHSRLSRSPLTRNFRRIGVLTKSARQAYLAAFIVTRKSWRAEMIKRSAARYNSQTGKWEWGEPAKESRY
jgi:hypothetical protein